MKFVSPIPLRLSLIGLLLSLLPAWLCAQRRSAAEMDSIARAVLQGESRQVRPSGGRAAAARAVSPMAVRATSSSLVGAAPSAQEAFYVYTPSNGGPGYAIVSADKQWPAVLAFSPDAPFRADDVPDALREMLAAYARMDRFEPAGTTEADATATAVEPLLGQIAYNQIDPYNRQCPLYNSQRTLTGCVATAMAQLLAYHRHPARMSGSDISYTSASYNLPVTWSCTSTRFDWDNLLDEYTVEMPAFTETMLTGAPERMLMTGLQTSSDYPGYLELSTFTNFSTATYNGIAQVLLADEQGTPIRPVGEALDFSGLGSYYHYPTFYLRHSLPADLSDGTYRLYVGTQVTGSTQWAIVKRATNTLNVYTSPRVECYLTVQKSGVTYTIGSETFACGYTPEQADAVATLSAACGAAAKADYGITATGANVMESAKGLRNYLGYDAGLAYLTSDYFTDQGRVDYLCEELSARRPIYCSGYSEEGSGHAFLMDGYRYEDGTPYFHINWGWGGMCDGYFLLSNLTPQTAGAGGDVVNYGYDLSFLTGVRPETDTDNGWTMAATDVATDSTEYKPSDWLEISAYNLSNRSVDPFSGAVTAYAVDAAGNEWKLGEFYSLDGLQMGYYYATLTNYVSLPSAMPTGDYTLVLRAKATSSTVEKDVLMPTRPAFHVTNPANTGIATPETEPAVPAAYDLGGRKLPQGDIPKGVYIQDGKKRVNLR